MSTFVAVIIWTAYTILAGAAGGVVTAWSLRKGILADIRAEKAGDLAE